MGKQDKPTKPDTRFSSIQTDPRFKLPKKKAIRGELDSRFKDALENDERFTQKAHTDKYGRRIKKKGMREELGRYYNFDEDEIAEKEKEAGDEEADEDESKEANEDEIEDEYDSDDVPEVKPVNISQKPRLSMRELIRGEGVDSSSSESESSDEESDSDSDSDVEEVAEDEYVKIRVARESIPQGDESKRLAVVNLDWDNVNSTDLMAAFSSFLPPQRSIVSVKIFPSEYGKQQMALEEHQGPAQDLFDAEASDNKDKKKSKKTDAEEQDEDYSSSRLRKYQLQRLQYYYAVVECDSVQSASEIYSACDGTEFESTANFFDFRFVPDEVDFDGDTPRDVCFKVPASYRPTAFTTDALQHSKVKLTWDETPKERARIAQKVFSQKDMESEDIKAYLASESESDEDEQSLAQRYHALINEVKDNEKTTDGEYSDHDAVEITFNPVLEGKEAKLEIVGDKSAGKATASAGDNPEDNLSTIEKYRLKEKQRRLRRMENFKVRKAAEGEEKTRQENNNKAELELLAMDDELLIGQQFAPSTKDQKTEKNGRKLRKRAAKNKVEAEAEADFDTADPRFQALYEDPDFAIDSTLPQYKKTKGMERIITERRKRQAETDNNSGDSRPTSNNHKRKQNESVQQLASKLRRKHAN